MANLEKTHHQLEKAEKRLKKYSKSQKQLQIQFVRKQVKKGKFKTKANLVLGEKADRYAGQGLIHKAVNLQTRVTGDKPSVTKSLKSLQPKTIRGKALKKSAQFANFMAHDTVQTAVNLALASETATLKTGQAVQRNVKYKLKQKYRQEAIDDYHRGSIATLGIAADAVKGTRSHFKQKKAFKLEKARYKVKKAEYKLFVDEQYKPKLVKSRSALKNAKKDFQERKLNFKQFQKSHANSTAFTKNVHQTLYRKRKQQYKLESKSIKTTSKSLKTDKKFQRKINQKQWQIANLSRPAPLLLKPAGYTEKKLTASGWQKAVNADSDNDFLAVADFVKRHGVDRAAAKIQPSHLKEKHQKKKNKLEDRKSNTQQKLQTRENKLKEKSNSKKRRKKKKPKNQSKASLSDKLKKAAKDAFRFVKNAFSKEARNVLLSHLAPILLIALVFVFILMIFSGILGGSGFVLGTYASQDYDLSEAEKYYTSLAYNMNESILKVGDSSKWKTGLKELGANTSNMKDTPDNWYWGRSSVYDWDAVYDFDVYKLWAFLCAYYYDFDADDNGDIKYWEFDGDTEDLLEDVFNAEYEFVYWYDNKSRWEELASYNFFGGGNAQSGTYYRAEQEAYIYDDNSPYKYRFKPIAYTSELSQYFDGEGYVCINADYRVLDPNDNYVLTGYMIMDNRYYSGMSEPFYYYDNSLDTFYFMHDETRYDRSFWGWDGTDAWFLISPTDTQIWNSGITDACMYGYYEKYYWKTDCNLYYNVEQKKTFDEILKEKLTEMSNSEERLAYYNLLAGNEEGTDPMYGNHQTLRNMLSGDSIRDYEIKLPYGYYVSAWNESSDGLYQGIKVYCTSGESLYAPFDCEIIDVDTDENKITLRKDDVQYWYDGSGGTKRDTEVTIANAKLLSGYEKGDALTEGEEFAKTTAGNVNFHVEIDTDGCGWDYVDPRLVIY